MTKFDHKSQMPKLFTDNNLSILPVSRGNYVIGEFETFHDFAEDDIEIKKIHFPHFLESINHQDITSEAIAINCAFVSEIIQDFTGEYPLHPTVSGRMSSSLFDFKINSGKGLLDITVNNSQIEIDGGYEGTNSLNIIEAKNSISDDFLIRQLFYPYRLWTQKVKKKVRPIFLTYTNGVFHFREYVFTDVEHYNSLRMVDQKKYSVQDGVVNIETIQQILNSIVVKKEPEIPFPQADSFERIINLCELLNQKHTLTKEEITQNYDFNERQTDYYSNAGRYLGLFKYGEGDGANALYLTEKSRDLFRLSIFHRQIEFVKLILSHIAFKRTLELYLAKGSRPTKQEVVKIMHHSNLWNIDSESTYKRRSSTIMGWINWIMNHIEE
jgi:hypothetical protein